MAASTVRLAVCGLHLTGQPLNKQLVDLGARLVRTCRSSQEYKLYAIRGQQGAPTKPGMVLVTDGSGNRIHLEIWDLPIEKFGNFMIKVPPPLAIGTVRLEDGDSCHGFVAEGYVAQGNEDITHLGSWLEYLKQGTRS